MKTLGKAVLGCVLAACLSSTAMAKPATLKDFEGKKICWTPVPGSPSGAVPGETTYYARGKFYNTYWGHGTLTKTPQGFHADTDNGSYDSRPEKLPDGTFKSTVNINGLVIESTGRYCP
jgi:hypothetical protein